MICRFGLLVFFWSLRGDLGKLNLASSVKVFAKILGLGFGEREFLLMNSWGSVLQQVQYFQSRLFAAYFSRVFLSCGRLLQPK